MTEQRKSIPWYWWTVAVVAVLSLYPLSAGPACWLFRNGYISRGVYLNTYLPLMQFIDTCPQPVQNVLLWSYRCSDEP